MRTPIFLLLLLSLSTQVKGQDSPLFVIVSCSEGVKLDGQDVSLGQQVIRNSGELTVPRRGYVGVINNEGLAFELTNSISVKSVVDKVHAENNRILFGARYRESEIEIIGRTNNLYSQVVGDSILLALLWIDRQRQSNISCTVKFLNMTDQSLREEMTVHNWKTIEIKSLLESDDVLFEIKSIGVMQREHFSVKSPEEDSKNKLKFDLSRIPQDISNEKEFQLAIYHLNHFYYDHLFLLYQLERSYQPQNKIFSNYIAQQKKKYQFELFDFHK